MLSRLYITPPDSIDEISAHIRRSWYAGGRIVSYEIFDISRAIVNEWSNLTIETIRSWPPGQPYLALHDISHRGVAMKYSGLHLNIINPAITEEGKERLCDLIKEGMTFHGYIAPLVSIHFSGYFTRVLTAKELQRQSAPNIQHKIFTEREAALRWLEGAIKLKKG